MVGPHEDGPSDKPLLDMESMHNSMYRTMKNQVKGHSRRTLKSLLNIDKKRTKDGKSVRVENDDDRVISVSELNKMNNGSR